MTYRTKITVDQSSLGDYLGFEFSAFPYQIMQVSMIPDQGPKVWATALRLLADHLDSLEGNPQ